MFRKHSTHETMVIVYTLILAEAILHAATEAILMSTYQL